MNGGYERSRAAAKGSYERRYERDFLLRVTMPVSRCSPDSRACRRSNAPRPPASPGARRPLQSGGRGKKLSDRVFAVSRHAERVSGAPSRRLAALHLRELKLSTFIASSFPTSFSKETAPRPHDALAPCSKSRHRHAPRPSASSLGQEKQKRAETAEL
jgi:hypothetical protein